MVQTFRPKPKDTDIAQQTLTEFSKRRNQTVSNLKLENDSLVMHVVEDVLTRLARGEAIQVIPIHHELTTQEAANWLGVSRPHLVKLLEQGLIPFHKVGNQRRVRFDDLQAFQQQARANALDDLSQLQQEMGLYS